LDALDSFNLGLPRMQVRGVGEVIGGPAEIILGFWVIKTLNYVSGALNSLLILLQLDVGER